MLCCEGAGVGFITRQVLPCEMGEGGVDDLGFGESQSFGELARSRVERDRGSTQKKAVLPSWSACGVLALLSLLAGGWWFSQSVEYYQNFLLGFGNILTLSSRCVNCHTSKSFSSFKLISFLLPLHGK